MTSIVLISDTHTYHKDLQIPEGDILIHAGDLSKRGTPQELIDFDLWFGSLPHKHKVLIAGNHDFLFQTKPAYARELITSAIYLEDDYVRIQDITIYGAPWQPIFFDWAFNLPAEELAKKWALIPKETDILVTHGPPLGVLDLTLGGDHVGCGHLLNRVKQIQPKYHIFGHIHESYGQMKLDGYPTTFINASTCNRAYRPVNPPIVINL